MDPPVDPTDDLDGEDVTGGDTPAPIAADDYTGGPTGEAVTVSVLDNDSAPKSSLNTASVTILQPLTNGTITAVDPTTGAVSYVPDAHYEGTDEFTYRVCNVHGHCDTARVSTATPPVDLAVTITRTGGGTLAAGEVATYEVMVTNLGPRVAEGPLTLTLSASSQLADLQAHGAAWEPAPPAPSPRRGRARMADAAAAVSLQLPQGLAVGDPSMVALTGLVTGDPGAKVTVDAEVSGLSIELVYANNESSARDRIRAASGPVAPDPIEDFQPGADEPDAPSSLPATGADTPTFAVTGLTATGLGVALLWVTDLRGAGRRRRGAPLSWSTAAATRP